MTEKNELLAKLAESYQYRNIPFTLASGEKSHEYLDCRAALSDPKTLQMAAGQILDVLFRYPQLIDAVGGLTMGADPLAVAVSLQHGKLKWFSVRKEHKDHGAGHLIEGAYYADRIAILEDVSTTGQSALSAIHSCALAGKEIKEVISLVDRGGCSRIRIALVAGESFAPFGIDAPVSSVFNFEDISLVGRASLIALEAHGKQMYGEHPYSRHLQEVVQVVAQSVPYSPTLLAAAWLHDTPEDTAVKVQDLLDKGMPPEVVHKVDACTDGQGKNRKERKERPLKLIPQEVDSVVVKVADRIANAENAKRNGKLDLLGMYAKEQPTFYDRLKNSAVSAGVDVRPMWDRLDRALRFS